MRNAKHILEEYKQADRETRMNLYLFYRDVRREFTDIERIEEGAMKPKVLGANKYQKNKGCG